jgi:hypothetical protein
MANMQTYINAFVADHELDENITDDLIDLVKKCFTDYISHMSNEWLTAEVPSKKTIKNKTVKSSDKLENAADAESLEQLKGTTCTSVVLNNYCRDNGVRIGGTKKEIAERVWRHLQGEQLDDDTSPRSKPKKVVAKKEQHACFACNAKGQPCGIAATDQHEGEWFCFRHIDNASEILEAKATPKASSSKSSGVSKKPSASIKRKPQEEELEEEEE